MYCKQVQLFGVVGKKKKRFSHGCPDNYLHAGTAKYGSFVSQPLEQVPREAMESFPVDKALAWSDPTTDLALSRMLDWSPPEVPYKLSCLVWCRSYFWEKSSKPHIGGHIHAFPLELS